ncbi:WecB/TagA/CpsF family glycosyltransferase [Microbacterium sp. EYE_5]|uniref:WecB/TagA/CpsF family glycosyltransferase n=1 Tax=unclassified Microbacterium TaxID=2609290 RepID=UPI0020057F54|nr:MULTISPECIES: WecB/TagA/CpsF family glycosyltransferase [unclassified Microbacterium]MCK6079875.1 WecB/TagA/CpsF family glycosyltransferase [Microbacterium sp. EYE_382]MCK6085146.1 WecB/TagA/CpsF family glycosyltransferase [Microbacterium sp. EYE_384]MCK6122628.1 WecB/TagA/CpsF family glycosyltransferase [Microbacterium sp. EYE_80]MCK6125909.1 WecB/TagA/CpsF family glycosyltransferase [Microbacterium sp. EYE_79]MCK6140830.1 WecB/TagA/CpsF family glycosyltransferase [Microbacterium sp. EYE_3
MAMRVATTPIRTRGVTADLSSTRVAPRPSLLGPPTIHIAGTDVHLTDTSGACDVIARAVRHPGHAPLAVVSVNLDHVHHAASLPRDDASRIRHLNLIDGAPIARQATRLTGTEWPRLAGSDLIGDVLARAHTERWRVAVLGGSAEIREALHHRVETEWPGVRLIGHWTPSRDELASPEASAEIAAQIRHADVDIVLVCLGKPRQEQWINDFGEATGARVLLAFGAVVDFLAGRVSRAPRWVCDAGFEWMWRLMLEPKRLAKRYLVEGPPAYMAVRRSSGRQGA